MKKTEQLYDEIIVKVSIPPSKASSQLKESEYELVVDGWCEWLRGEIEALIDGSTQCDARPELPKGTTIETSSGFPVDPAYLPGDQRVSPNWQ